MLNALKELKARPWVRVAAVALLLGLLWWGASALGWTENLDKERVRTVVQDAGALGVLAFVGIVLAGSFVQVPGLVFLAAAGLIWGAVQGALIAYPALLCAQVAVFSVTRAVGGSPLGSLQGRVARRVLAHLEDRPIRTVVFARFVFWLHPAFAVFMALSHIRRRDYVVGEAIGLVLPCVVGTVAFGLVLAG